MSLFQFGERQGESFGALALFILLTGVAFVFSMPSATYVREISQMTLSRGTPLVFFATYTLAFVLFGVNRGASASSRMRWGASCVLTMLGSLVTALFMTAPFLVYSRIILLPLDRIAILWIAAYSFLASIAYALMAQWFDIRAVRLGRESVLARYGSAVAMIALPLAFHFAPPGIRLLSLLSPLSATLKLHAGATSMEALFLFAIPVIGASIAFLLIGRERRLSRVRV